MADEEVATVKAHVGLLSKIPVTLPDDYTPDPRDLPRKFTAFPIELPPPPAVYHASATPESHGSITLTIKSTKPVISFSLEVHPTDTIASIKERLSSTHARAPPADVQRLLIKGKVLADNKLLKEYDAIEDGAVLTLMVKPGTTWNAEDKTAVNKGLSPVVGGDTSTARRHSRTPSEGGAADQYPVPSLVLETPASPTSGLGPKKRAPVPLSLDTDAPPRPSSPMSATDTSTYSEVISSTSFWEHLREFLEREFAAGHDADAAFESFLVASKGSLSASDVARIRDAVGVTGMAGT